MAYNLQLLIDKIKREKGFDLSGYRESTISRRIERRMQFDGAGSLEEYVRMIDRDYHLYWRLISDFFIGVTDFFRDREIWDIVQEKVLPELITLHNTKAIDGPLRIWSAGCSTGEETYSLAIAVREVLRKGDTRDLPAFIYGTDIMEDKLEEAKNGIYREEKLKNVDGDIRFRYFEHIADSVERIGKEKLSAKRYTLNANLRRLTRFRKYDLVRDEELRGFDIIVCRNVLIYFQKHLQEKVLVSFHKTLNRDGILWLGTAESLSDRTKSLFEPLYKEGKIFKKI